MKKFIVHILALFLRFSLIFRYRVKVVGMERLVKENLTKPGGVIFLPNHPALFVDPSIVTLAVWPKFPIRPIIEETYYFIPVVHWMMKMVDALPVPNFEISTNKLKKKRHEKVIEEVIKGVNSGQNLLLYPAGRLKHTGIEKIGGASAAHHLIHNAKDANIVLVRTKGLWGSMFSRALTGKVESLFPTIWEGVKIVLKNLIFFTPRREVIVELHPAPKDFPYDATRLELNRWLEDWYNQPDGLSEQEGELPGDSLKLVSYSRWKTVLPEIKEAEEVVEEEVKIEEVSADLQDKILGKISELTEIPKEKIKLKMSLSFDLGLDSLDTSELALFIQDEFDTGPIPVLKLTTVQVVMGIASKKIVIKEEEKEETMDLSKWEYKGERFRGQIAHGKTIPEVFLHNCERMGNKAACADMRSGVLSYSRLKIGVILLADYIKTLPGQYVGILLPASVGAYLSVLACQLAGKVPLMINWTVGSSHLKTVKELSKVQAILTSWAFLERLDKADLSEIDDMLIMLESVKREFSLFSKIKALFRSKRSTKAILKTFGSDKLTEDDQAVLLFTSGTESMPKGVPLSHKNLLSNIKAVYEQVELYSDDVLYGILPPFHAYGFNTSGLMELVAGVRVAFFPDPTDGKGVAKWFEKWGATVMSGAPSFIKSMLKAAAPEQLKTMRLCVTGAEKAPAELFKLLADIGKEQCLLEGYGITECSPVLTANRPGKPRVGVGSPVPGVELLLVHPETHKVLKIGEEGLILARGPNIFKGYLNPGLASTFLKIDDKEWYNTGDIGYLDEENRLTISGRKKRFIKVAGEMISLPAIEDTLLKQAPLKGWPMREEGPTLAVIAKEIPGQKPKML